MKTILLEANAIVYDRAEEKIREYGPFDESLKKVSTIASELCNKKITTEDVYKILISLKLSRMSYNHKHDTYLDMISYIAALYNFKNKQNEQSKTNSKKPSKRIKRKF
jgi:hypothetical protein